MLFGNFWWFKIINDVYVNYVLNIKLECYDYSVNYYNYKYIFWEIMIMYFKVLYK